MRREVTLDQILIEAKHIFGEEAVRPYEKYYQFACDDNDKICDFIAKRQLEEALIMTYPANRSVEHVRTQISKKLQSLQQYIDFQNIPEKTYLNILEYEFKHFNSFVYTKDDLDSDGILPRFSFKIPLFCEKLNKEVEISDEIINNIKSKLDFLFGKISTSIEKYAQYVGYTVAAHKHFKYYENEYVIYGIICEFEAQFYNTMSIDDVKIPRFLYHITSSDVIEKIQKNGLVPKSKSRLLNYKPRIYLFGAKNLRKMIGYVKQAKKQTYDQTNEYAIVTIDKLKLKNDVKFSQDAMFSNAKAFWTYSNIPKNAIIKIEKIENLNDNYVLKSIFDSLNNDTK